MLLDGFALKILGGHFSRLHATAELTSTSSFRISSNYVQFLQEHGIKIDTEFSYSVKYRGDVYAHDFNSALRKQFHVFDMPASLFARYLDFFDVETATPMQTWDQGTRHVYEAMSAPFRDKIYLNRWAQKVRRMPTHVDVEDEAGEVERFDEVIFACNANQTLMILDQPSFLEAFILSSVRYERELHNHTVVHYDASVLPNNETEPLATRSNFIKQYGARWDNYEITYIMHNH
jgi:hypothetical protein